MWDKFDNIYYDKKMHTHSTFLNWSVWVIRRRLPSEEAILMEFQPTTYLLGLPRFNKRLIAVVVDISICVATVAFAYYLRLDGWVYPTRLQWLSYVGSVILAIPLFITFGLYRAVFRYAGSGALMTIVRACTVYTVIYSAVFTAVGVLEVPRTTGIIQPLLLFVAIAGSRAVARYWLSGDYIRIMKLGSRRRALVYGAGMAGRQLAAALGNSEDIEIVAFIDDDRTLQSGVLNGKSIYSSVNLAARIKKLQIDDVLLAMPSVSRTKRNQLIDALRDTQVSIRTLPALIDLANGSVTVNDLRELDIEDLLGRNPVKPNKLLLTRNIVNQIVLVTGAGGSIGSELCRHILTLNPSKLLLVDVSEYSLYTIHQELEGLQIELDRPGPQLIPLLASVQDERRMSEIIGTWRPATIYHAAAYKHVPLVEHNPCEGIRNNAFGTLTTARIAQREGVGTFVLISTDKAVRPTNLMGATKRLAELCLQALASEDSKTVFAMVRFGNVLGSSGSVVPLFRKQIRAGGPVTITHKEVTRYFMSIPEAAQLVIQAGAMAKGGEVFVLDMGDPVRIVDLARNMIQLSGLQVKDDENPSGDIEIQVVGLRPGEKLYEELLIANLPEPTSHSRIFKANEHMLSRDVLDEHMRNLDKFSSTNMVDQARKLILEIIPEFEPKSEVMDWIHMERVAKTLVTNDF
jgi:FlaA1/EpsC-like NDP-sugar epimerase